MKPVSISGTVRNIIFHERQLCSIHLMYVFPAFVPDLHRGPKRSSSDCTFAEVTTFAEVQLRQVRVKSRLSAGALRTLMALSELVSPVTCAICAAEPEEAIAWYRNFEISTLKSVELSPLPNCLQNGSFLSKVLMI
jgi:hypothetical protein